MENKTLFPDIEQIYFDKAAEKVESDIQLEVLKMAKEEKAVHVVIEPGVQNKQSMARLEENLNKLEKPSEAPPLEPEVNFIVVKETGGCQNKEMLSIIKKNNEKKPVKLGLPPQPVNDNPFKEGKSPWEKEGFATEKEWLTRDTPEFDPVNPDTMWYPPAKFHKITFPGKQSGEAINPNEANDLYSKLSSVRTNAMVYGNSITEAIIKEDIVSSEQVNAYTDLTSYLMGLFEGGPEKMA